MGLEKLLAGALVIGLASSGCGGSGVGGHRGDESSDADNTCQYDCDDDRDSDGRGGNNNDSDAQGGNLLDGADGGNDDPNRAPNLNFVYETGHPLAGEVYAERTVRRMTDTPYVAEVSDPDGDSLECKFEFKQGDETVYSRGWDSNPSVIHSLPNGDYTLIGRTRDPSGMEAAPYNVDLHVVDNIPPVVRLADCPETDPSDGLCVYRGAPWEDICLDGSPSYDEDGSINLYRIRPDINGSASSGSDPVRCAIYSSLGTREGSYSVVDDEGIETAVSFRTIIE